MCAIVLFGSPPARAQQPKPPQEQPAVTAFARNWTRMESWSWFEPPAGGGDPDYTFLANRLQFGVTRQRPRYDLLAALQYVQFGGLPRDATGPGPLGTGALYFDHSGRTDSRQLYLRYLSVRFKGVVRGLDVQVGRMAYASGAEAASGVPKVETVKRQRVDSRLVGEFEWSIYQRGFDGVRVDFDRSRWRATAAALRPTQGGFEDAAGVGIDDIDLFAAALTRRPGGALPGTEVQVFGYHYDDRRQVRARPDNTGRGADRIDVQVATYGATVVRSAPIGPGELDALLWAAAQTGSWFEQSHRAYALAIEAGYQWTTTPWRPWVRAGVNRASGDEDPADDRHGTFFPMLPTVRRYSQSATYSPMNLHDTFAQVMLRPTASMTLRIDLHRVGLAKAADRWYAGSGATQESGTTFGYAGRLSRGATGLGTVVEGSADYAFNEHWSLNGYAGCIRGGDVVRRNFADTRFTFVYLESVVRFH
jgi:hypothetical protein